MANVNFFNCPPRLQLACEQFVSSLNLQRLSRNLDIIFPFNFNVGQILASRTQVVNATSEQVNRISGFELKQTYPAENYRIVFSPKNVANNLICHPMKDLACAGIDLALGQEDVNRLPYAHYFRLPMWCVELFGFMPTVDEIAAKISYLEGLRKQDPFKRSKFLGLVARRDRKCYFTGVKGMILDLLVDDEQLSSLVIESAGLFRHDTNDLWEKYGNQKIEYLKQFTFNLCPESMHFLSIVTEKIAHCLEAGCIPVYWGDIYADAKYFNLDAMIRFDPSRRVDIVPKLKEAIFYHQDLVQENIFNPGAAQMIFADIYYPFLEKLENDLGVGIYSLRADYQAG